MRAAHCASVSIERTFLSVSWKSKIEWQNNQQAYLLANDRRQKSKLCCSANKHLVLLAETKLGDAQELLRLRRSDLGVLVGALLPLLHIPLV